MDTFWVLKDSFFFRGQCPWPVKVSIFFYSSLDKWLFIKSPDKWLFRLLKLKGCVPAVSSQMSPQTDLVTHLFIILSHGLESAHQTYLHKASMWKYTPCSYSYVWEVFLDSAIELLSFFFLQQKRLCWRF